MTRRRPTRESALSPAALIESGELLTSLQSTIAELSEFVAHLRDEVQSTHHREEG